jgi:hypothetical protein
MRFAASRAWKDPLSGSAASSVILAFRESWPLYFEIDDATGIRPMTVVPLPGRDRISREPLPRRGDRPYSADRFLAGLCVDRILGHRRRQEDQIPVVPGHAHDISEAPSYSDVYRFTAHPRRIVRLSVRVRKA